MCNLKYLQLNQQNSKKQIRITTSRLVTFAATKPKAMMYRTGCSSYTCCTDFWYIVKAGIRTMENGIIGESTLVPYRNKTVSKELCVLIVRETEKLLCNNFSDFSILPYNI